MTTNAERLDLVTEMQAVLAQVQPCAKVPTSNTIRATLTEWIRQAEQLQTERDGARNTAALLEDECAMLSKELSAHSTRLGDSK